MLNFGLQLFELSLLALLILNEAVPDFFQFAGVGFERVALRIELTVCLLELAQTLLALLLNLMAQGQAL